MKTYFGFRFGHYHLGESEAEGNLYSVQGNGQDMLSSEVVGVYLETLVSLWRHFLGA